MITLAIDASTKSTGIAIFKQNKLFCYKCIKQNDNNTFTRIREMTKRIRQIYQQYQPTNIIMQDILPQDVKHNQKIFKALVYLQAMIVLQLDRLNAPEVELTTANHWRKICGIKTGRGIKRQVLKEKSVNLIKQIYNINVNDDIADAICIGIAYIVEHKSAF